MFLPILQFASEEILGKKCCYLQMAEVKLGNSQIGQILAQIHCLRII